MRHNLLARRAPAAVTLLLWAAVAVVALAVSAEAVALRARVRALEAELSAARGRESAVEAEIAAAERRAAPYKQAESIAAALEAQGADPGLVRRLEAAVPGDVWLSSLTMSRDTVVIDGRSVSAGSIARAAAAMRAVAGVADARVTVVTREPSGLYEFHMTLQPLQGARGAGAAP